ncbi:MAG: murein biosynthesis integral membrane protein MurJ [Gemmatimonadetes bacterium]|nr:murein biosynthesis integral membrane protein MurJ [Gemmatimonadota bacterium]
MAASSVASGILVSRVLGLVRGRVFAHYFGTGDLADAWTAALRIPNVIQNLLGEGSLSASFIPAYVRLLEEGREREAGRAAGAVLGLLAVAAGAMAALGSWAAPHLVSVLTWGFTSDGRAEIVTTLLRLLFPMAGLLVVSAWALGVLNSHRRFFVSYVAPSLWNLAMIVAMVAAASRGMAGVDLLTALAWGALAGGAMQLLFQLPFLIRHLTHVRPSLDVRSGPVREVVRNFVPAVASRGAVNIGALIDQNLATLLAVGAVGLMGYAQPLYILPISLFGMSIAASELPELSRDRVAGVKAVRDRTEQAVGRVLFWLVPVTAGYILFREECMVVFRSGAFGPDDAAAAGLVLAAFAPGLPASGASRVLSSALYAFGDTRTAARISYLRILTSAAVGASLMFPFDRFVVGGLGMGAAGLAVGATAGAWLEFALLRRALRERLLGLSLGGRHVGAYLLAAVIAVGVGLAIRAVLPPVGPIVQAAATIGPVAAVYLFATHRLGFPFPSPGTPRRR